MARYLDTPRFRELSIMPSSDVDQIEALESEWIQRRLDRAGDFLDVRLAKRYAVPFGDDPSPPATVRANVPGTVEDWIVGIVTLEAYSKRGFNPSSASDEAAIVMPATRAREEILEAANSETGLFELPMRSTATSSGVSRGGPLGYSETSPYVWTDRQVEDGAAEDAAGIGT